MNDLIEFLRARLDEDEWAAGAARNLATNARKRSFYRASLIANADRDLRDAQAKRQILDRHYPTDPCDAHDASLDTIPCDTLLLLAFRYADHLDYREDWRPERQVTAT